VVGGPSPRTRRTKLIIATCAVVFVGGLWFAFDRARPQAEATVPDKGRSTALSTDLSPQLEAANIASSLEDHIEGPGHPPLSSLAPADGRNLIPSDTAATYVHGQVQDQDGIGIVGATITWTAWDPEFLGFVSAGVPIPASKIRNRTVETATGSDGSFRFTDAPVLFSGQPSYFWATSVGHTAQFAELFPDSDSPNDELSISLGSGTPSSVIVALGDKRVKGAEVVQRIRLPQDPWCRYAPQEYAPKAQLTYLRTLGTSDRGRARVPGLESQQHLVARSEELCSAPWEGPSGQHVRLQLGLTFELSGVVALPDEFDEDWGRARIQVVRYRGPLCEEVESIPLNLDGSFGPAAIALVDSGRYAARLDGNAYVMQEEELPRPRPGDELFIQFEAEIGHVKWFMTVDEAGAPIPNAILHAEWERNGTVMEREYRGREDGYVLAIGIPAGFLSGTMSAAGYATQPIDPIVIPEDPLWTYNVTMPRGFKIEGRCFRGLEPARDFEVRYWAVDDRPARGRMSVTNSEDGTFALDSLASARMALTAISPTFERSVPITIDLAHTPDPEVLLQLTPPRLAKGMVLDAATHTPIPGARVTAFSSHIYDELDPIGPPIESNHAGEFELARLAPGLNIISIQARGFSDRELKVYAPDQGDIDLGAIVLVAAQPLTAEIHLPEGHDPTQWILTANGIGSILPTPFDSEGMLRVESASEGAWNFEVRDIEGLGTVLTRQFQWLRSGEEWHLVFDLVGGRSLAIEVTDVDSRDIHMGFAQLRYFGVDGSLTSNALNLDDSGELHIPGGVGPGPVVVNVVAQVGGQKLSGSTVHGVANSDPDEIVLRVQLGEFYRRFRVVDTMGKPVSGTLVLLRSTLQPEVWLGQGVTDADGLTTIDGVPAEVDSVDLTSSAGGKHNGIPIELPASPDQIVEITLDSSALVSIRVLDTGTPQSGVTCRLWDLDGHTLVASGQSPDSEGRLRIERLSPGAYMLRVDGPGYWPVSRRVNAESEASEQAVEIRSTGSIDLEFLRADGSALANTAVELECLDLQENSSDWVARGLIAGAEGSLWTDSSGRLVVTEIPHGEYRWMIEGASGSLRLGDGESLGKRLVLP